MEDPGKWSVDKRIPLATIISLAVLFVGQTFAGIWAMSNLWTRVQTIEEFVRTQQPQAAQIAVIQEKVTTLQTSINKIEAWLQVLRPPTQESPPQRR